MKHILLLVCCVFSLSQAYSQENKAIFLHHSTGGAVFYDGQVAEWIADFNTSNGTNYEVTERNFPESPWPWANYPYDFWKLWVDGSCDNSDPDIECLESLATKYELIIFKHCFPGAEIGEDTGTPSISSSDQRLENYKLQYRALRSLMDGMPNTKFMIWTLAPLHRLATSTESAARANEFVNWVKTDFLTEDAKSHPNIFIFDFYGAVAELNANPANGVQFCLKYDYEGSHTGNDSHPNSTANEYAGPLFARAIVNALGSPQQAVSAKRINSEKLIISPIPVQTDLNLLLQDNMQAKSIEIVSIDGKTVMRFSGDLQGKYNVSALQPGLYIMKVETGSKVLVKQFIKN